MDRLIEDIKRIKKLMKVESEIDESEISEEGEGGETTGGSTGGSGYPTVKKHSDTYQTKRGKANTLDMKTKWESGRTFGKTYMNDPKYKWESGRTMGSTGP